MAGYNRIIMMGNLTRDPEYKQLSSGQSVCRLGLASNRQFKNRQTGMMVQEVCFVDIDVWGPQAESCNQYLQKGRLVLIEGRLKLDTWQDTDGNRRSKHSIVADRVTFLSASVQQDDDFPGSEKRTPGNISQATPSPQQSDDVVPTESVKKEVTAATLPTANNEPAEQSESESSKKDVAAKPTTGELDFKDEKPFEDDLPF